MRVAAAAILIALSGVCLAEDAPPERLGGHGGPVRGIAVSGREALSASFDYTIIHWALEGREGRVIRRLIGHEAAVNDVAFVPGGRLAVSASDDGTVGVWDLSTGALLKRFRGAGDKMPGLAVSPDGRRAAAAGWDRTARLFDLTTLEPGPVLSGHDGNVNAVAFAEDGATLYTASYDGAIRSWRVEGQGEPRILHRHGWGVNVLRALPGGRLFFGALNGTAAVLDAGGEVAAELQRQGAPVLSAAVHAGRGLIAYGGGGGQTRVVALDGFATVAETENPYGPVWALAFSEDGRMLYQGGLDDHAIGWRIDPQKPFEPVQSQFPRRFQVQDAGDPGERQFARKCSVCHTLTPDGGNRAGPTLHGVFGRKAGTVPGYPYSAALKGLDMIWTEETIGALFEHGPDQVTPGSKMPLQRMRDPQERAALIAYLKRAAGQAEDAQGQEEKK